MRAAVIGCGAIAHQHLPFLADSPLAELVAVCDMSPVTAEFAKSRFGAERAYTDAVHLLAQESPQVVHVLTPPHTHGALVTAALDAGAHVICEKPLAPSAAETVVLLDHATKCERFLFESRNYIFNDPVIKLRRLIDERVVGDVLEADLLLSVDFLSGVLGDQNLEGPAVNLPGGAVHDFMPHLAYLFLHLARYEGGSEEVHGILQCRSRNDRAGYDLLDALVVAGNVRGRLRITADVRPETFRVIVRGRHGSVETDLFNPYMRYEGPPNVGTRTALGQVWNGLMMIGGGLSNFSNKVMQHGTYHGIPRMLEAIYLTVNKKGPPPYSPDDMIASARLVDRLVNLASRG